MGCSQFAEHDPIDCNVLEVQSQSNQGRSGILNFGHRDLFVICDLVLVFFNRDEPVY